MSVETVHRDGSTYRVIDQDDERYKFEIVGDEDDVEDGYQFTGDGEAPDDAVEALQEWVDEYHQ